MHDTAALEEAGIATVFVASEVFRDAAKVQAKSLGTTPTSVFVAHPIQDRTAEEISELASASSEELISALLD